MTVKRVYWDEETHGLRDTPTRHGWHVELVRATEHDAEVTRLRSELDASNTRVAQLTELLSSQRDANDDLRSELDAAKSALAHSFCDLREEVLRLTKELAEARRALRMATFSHEYSCSAAWGAEADCSCGIREARKQRVIAVLASAPSRGSEGEGGGGAT